MDGSVKRPPISWGIAAAIAIHSLLALLLAIAPLPERPAPQPEIPIEVEIVASRRQPPAPPASPSAPGPAAVVPEPSKETGAATPSPAETDQDGLIRADHLMSADVLADPRSREARIALAGFATAERMEQLCGVEAMEQVHAWDSRFQPDSVVAYAMADSRISRSTVVADGAAIRSHKQWFRMRYRCALSADLTRVVSFSFVVGQSIPKSDWEEHNLPDGDADME